MVHKHAGPDFRVLQIFRELCGEVGAVGAPGILSDEVLVTRLIQW